MGKQNSKMMPFDEFLHKANMVHDNKFTYDETSYYNRDEKGKIKIVCPKHGEFWQTPSGHLSGKGCPECGKLKLSKRFALTTEEFIEKAKKKHLDNPYDYSQVHYVNGKTPIKINCPLHGIFEQTPENHLQGKGCPECGRKRISQKLLKKFEVISQKAAVIHKSKYKYIDETYQGIHTNTTIICPQHGSFTQTWNNHLQGKGCAECKKEAISQTLTMLTSTFIQKSRVIHGDAYDYSKVDMFQRDDKGRVCIICPKHGEFWQVPSAHLLGQGCPACVHQQSKPEIEMIEFLKQYLKPEQIIERDRELLNDKEVDILLPDFHVGIEFNGLYWHSLKHKPDINYHRDKMLLANSKGYRLIQIFEDEWLEHKEIVLNKLRHVINADVGNSTIGARKTIVGQINRQIAKAFLEQYHIQGYVGSSVYLGAYYGDELVGVMSFTEEQSKMWNLTRFTTKTDYKLPGLASKMFKYFKTNFEFDEVKSFLDLRWNQGLYNNTVYDKLGFVLEESIRPDYRYVVGNQRIHKFNMRKQKLNKKYGLSLTMTEREMCNELGFERIYDCGLAKYIFKKKM